MEKLGIVIVHFSDPRDTYKCLQSLKLAVKQGLCIKCWVVDNDPDHRLEKKKVENFGFDLLVNSRNLGFAGGVNVGIKMAVNWGAQGVVLINNDSFVDKDFLTALVRCADENLECGLIGAKVYFAPGSEYYKDRYTRDERGRVIWYAGGSVDWNNVQAKHRGIDAVDKGQYKSGQTGFVAFCACLLRRQVIAKVGYLKEEYFMYCEDLDYCERVKRAGYKFWFCDRAVVWHRSAGSTAPGSAFHDYYLTRNRLLFGLRFAPIRTKLALIKQSFKLFLGGRRWERRGVRDFYCIRFGQGSYRND